MLPSGESLGPNLNAGHVPRQSNTGWPVKNAWNPGIGSQYCTTGRSSGFQCSWIVRSLNVTICYTENYPGCAHNLAGFNSSSFGPIIPGDSGGPLWYRYQSEYKAGIRGVISGRFWDVYTMNWMSYATQYQSIADWYVAQALTSG
jgi:hypothetical protein